MNVMSVARGLLTQQLWFPINWFTRKREPQRCTSANFVIMRLQSKGSWTATSWLCTVRISLTYVWSVERVFAIRQNWGNTCEPTLGRNPTSASTVTISQQMPPTSKPTWRQSTAKICHSSVRTVWWHSRMPKNCRSMRPFIRDTKPTRVHIAITEVPTPVIWSAILFQSTLRTILTSARYVTRVFIDPRSSRNTCQLTRVKNCTSVGTVTLKLQIHLFLADIFFQSTPRIYRSDVNVAKKAFVNRLSSRSIWRPTVAKKFISVSTASIALPMHQALSDTLFPFTQRTIPIAAITAKRASEGLQKRTNIFLDITKTLFWWKGWHELLSI